MTSEHPSSAEKKIMKIIKDNISQISSQKLEDTLLIIPTVVHIIHYNGNGDISDLQVEDGIRVRFYEGQDQVAKSQRFENVKLAQKWLKKILKKQK